MKSFKSSRCSKFMALMLVAMIVMSFTGCGNQSGTAGVVSSAVSAQAVNSSTTQSTSPVEVKVTFWEMGWDGPEQGKDVINPEIEKKTGLKIIYESWKVSNPDEYKSKFGVMFASDEIPDVMFCDPGLSLTLVNNAGEGDKVWNLIDFINKSPNIKDRIKKQSAYYTDKNNGQLYFFPTQTSDYEFDKNITMVARGIYIRKDWLDKLGLKYPTTDEEFYNVLKQFKEKIQLLDGQKVIPLALNENLKNIGFMAANWFGGDPHENPEQFYTKDSNGKYISFFSPAYNKNFENYALFMHKLYNEGLLDKEFLTIKDASFVEKVNSGRVGAYTDNDWYMDSFNDNLQKTDKNAMFVMMPIFKGSGVDKVLGQPSGNSAPSGLFFSKKLSEEKMDAFFKFLDWGGTVDGSVLLSGGIEGVHWNKNADGKIESSKEFIDRTAGDWNKAAHEGVGYYSQLTNAPSVEVAKISAPGPRDKRPDLIESKKNMAGTVWNQTDKVFMVSPGPVELEKTPQIKTAWIDTLVKAITAKDDASCKAEIGKWTDTANKLGVEDIYKERNDLVNSLK